MAIEKEIVMRTGIVTTVLLLTSATLWCQQAGSGKPDAQQKVAELKQAIAANQAKLHKYQWLQTTQVSLKGKTRKDEEAQCHYDESGKVVKTPVGDTAPATPQTPSRGLRGRIVEKKVDEMKDYTERLKSLISHYAPPNPEMIQAAVQAGNYDVNLSGGVATLVFTNYYKPGDKVTFIFAAAAKKLQNYDVNTYLDDPKKDIVTLTNVFSSLPDGTNYLQQTILDAQGKQIKVTTTNQGYSLVAQ
jgi:hypothetical protein